MPAGADYLSRPHGQTLSPSLAAVLKGIRLHRSPVDTCRAGVQTWPAECAVLDMHLRAGAAAPALGEPGWHWLQPDAARPAADGAAQQC